LHNAKLQKKKTATGCLFFLPSLGDIDPGLYAKGVFSESEKTKSVVADFGEQVREKPMRRSAEHRPSRVKFFPLPFNS
jgi:hypothetical protein